MPLALYGSEYWSASSTVKSHHNVVTEVQNLSRKKGMGLLAAKYFCTSQ